MGAETSASEMVLPPRKRHFAPNRPTVKFHAQGIILFSCYFLVANKKVTKEIARNLRFRTSLSHVRTMPEIARTLSVCLPSRAVSLAVPNGHATSRHTGVWTWVQEDAGGT